MTSIIILDRYKVLSDKQFGFRKARLAQDAIAHSTAKIYNALDEKNPAIGVFVDLSEAFHTVCHPELLESLDRVGMGGSCYNLLKSYLEERVQYVKVEEKLSMPNHVKYGVPQGTILIPLLFSIYINDLFNIPSSGEIIGFADDTVLFYEDIFGVH